MQTQLGGSYWKETLRSPAKSANAWILPSTPVSDQTIVELQIQFPVAVDENGADGEFILRNIEAAFPRKAVGDRVIPK